MPRPAAGTLNAAYKITKRRDEDISAVAVRLPGDGRGRHRDERRGSPSAAWRRRRSGRRRSRRRWSASPGRRETVARPQARARRGLPADHRLARLGRLPRCGGAATCCGGSSSRRAARAGAAGRGRWRLMEHEARSRYRRSAAACTSTQRHDSAHKHVTGAAEYTDDIAEPVGTLHAYLGLADAGACRDRVDRPRRGARGAGRRRRADGRRHPGHNDMSPVGKHDDPVFAEGKVEFHGQPLFAVIAETRDAARRAAKLAKVEYRDLPHVTDVAEAMRGELSVRDRAAEARARRRRRRRWPARRDRLKGRDARRRAGPFLPRGQIAFAIPGEDDEVTVYSSTQHPTEVQHMVAHVLGVPSNAVTIIVRRMGGGFGGKETQPNLFAAVAALAAKKWGRAVKIRPDRDDDMVATGKRHDFLNDYEVGLRRRRAHPRGRRHLRRALRLLGRPLRAGHRPGAVPRRQRLLLSDTSGWSRSR